MDWQHDDDVEFEAFLRQFQLRTPPALPAGRRTMLVKLAVAAVVVLAFAVPFRWSLHKPADAVERPDPMKRVASPSASVTASPPSTVKGAPAPFDGRSDGASRSPAGTGKRSVIAGNTRSGAVAQIGPLRVGGAIKSPRRIVSVNAIYPEEAKAAGIEGVVVMRITIGEDGSVANVVVLQSVPELDEAAIESVFQWQYEPTLLNGVPVEVELTVTVSFQLR